MYKRQGGGEFTQDIDPQRGEVSYVFDKPVTTESMSMTIQKSVVPDGAEESDGGDNAAIFEDGEQVGGNGKQNETTVGKLQDATAVQKLQLYGYPGKDGGDSTGGADKAPARKESNESGSGAGGVDVAPEAS